jgi:tRNA(Arg) A34 adenosine deaminase TadA
LRRRLGTNTAWYLQSQLEGIASNKSQTQHLLHDSSPSRGEDVIPERSNLFASHWSNQWLTPKPSYEEGGCPIGGVIIDNETRKIVGKGHNTLVQENHPYNHGETSAARDAGRLDFSKTTMFTSLSPCDTCAALIWQLQFQRMVVGDVTNYSGYEEKVRQHGVHVDILEDPTASPSSRNT